MSDDPILGETIRTIETQAAATDESSYRPSPKTVTRLGLLIEGGGLFLALVVSRFGWYDRGQPLSRLFHLDWRSTLMWSGIGLAGSLALALAILLVPLPSFRDFRAFAREILVPLFAPLSLWQVAVISISAGIGEELLFRWCLQGGLQTVLPGTVGQGLALVITSIAFGLCHAISVPYVVFATLVGGLMGVVMIASGSVVPAILAHGLYDFVAILVLRRAGRSRARVTRDLAQGPE